MARIIILLTVRRHLFREFFYLVSYFSSWCWHQYDIITIFCLLRYTHAFQLWRQIDQWRVRLKVKAYTCPMQTIRTRCKLKLFCIDKQGISVPGGHLGYYSYNQTSGLHQFDLNKLRCKAVGLLFNTVVEQQTEAGVSFNSIFFRSSFLII